MNPLRLAVALRPAGALPAPRRNAPARFAPRHILAAIGPETGSVPRPSATRLEETPSAAKPGAPVIDVDFAVVSDKRARQRAARAPRTWFGKIKHALTLALWAVLIGLMIPPTVVLIGVLARSAG